MVSSTFPAVYFTNSSPLYDSGDAVHAPDGTKFSETHGKKVSQSLMKTSILTEIKSATINITTHTATLANM